MSKVSMNSQEIQKVQLQEIRDYRGNLSFAEEDNPIPFDIKSVFWSSVSEEKQIISEATIFLICLNGELEVCGGHTQYLQQPCEACFIPAHKKVCLNPKTDHCQILMVMDQAIPKNESAIAFKENLLEMPHTQDFLGLEGYFANSNTTLPFDIKRVYFTYNIPSFAKRGGHAHIFTKEIVFPIKGEFDVIEEKKECSKHSVHLKNPRQGIFLDTATWRELVNFENHNIILVLASEKYFEEDYIRRHKDFLKKYD